MYPQWSVMTCGLATALEPPHFNHAPVRGAIGASFSRRSRAGSFNPRTRVGCDQAPPGPPDRRSRFQSTHPRGVRRERKARKAHRCMVSIHAPAWGATSVPGACLRPSLFQSTHPRGVRRAGDTEGGHVMSSFNPRTRVGCDDSGHTGHCPTARFQSTHPRGVRLRPVHHVSVDGLFQSTHPRGVRPVPSAVCRTSENCFNPRTRVGCDMP